MNNDSVCQVLVDVLSGKIVLDKCTLYITPHDRVLGSLKNQSVASIMNVIGFFGPKSSAPHARPDIAVGIEGCILLVESQLLLEYGSQLRPDEQISVRWNNDKIVVVAIPRRVLEPFVVKPGSN